jgi:hypothetical protein
VSFRLRGWHAWAPGRESREAWYAWATGAGPDTTPSDNAGEAVPLLLRRRVSPLGQQALRAAWQFPESADARLVFSSRHGEFDRTLSILRSLAEGSGVSPADFTLSVHHALAGLLSIARGNRQGHTAVAAGLDSFGCGLLEAAACLAERPDSPVILVYYDRPLPPPYDTFDEGHQEPIAVALALVAQGEGEPLWLDTEPAPGGGPAPSLAKEFMRFALSGRAAASAVGERLRWRWRRDAAAA